MGLSHPLGDQDNLRRINLKPKGGKKNNTNWFLFLFANPEILNPVPQTVKSI